MSGAHNPASRARADGLLEREHEIEALDGLMLDAAAGEGRFVVIEAAAGVGKSSLLAEARGRAGRLRVLAARGGELEQEFPFGVVRQLFEAVIADPEQRETALAGAGAAAAPVFAAVGDQAGEESSFAALHGLYWLVLNLADRTPLLLAVDDLHWCDPPSLRFLSYLARRLDDLPVLLIATLRTAEPGADPSLLADLARDPLSVSLHLGQLTRDGSARLIRQVLPDADDGFCAECHEATGGVPLMLRQLVRALEVDHVSPTAANADVVRSIGPRAVSRTVLARLARLGPDATAVARAVAVLGEGTSLAYVAEHTGLAEGDVVDAARALVRAEILRAEPPLGFVHALVRHAVYDDLTAAEREHEHARAASMLLESGASPELVAGQLLLGPPGLGDWATDLLEQAASAAVARGAPESAVAYLRRALAEHPDPEHRGRLLLTLGRIEQEVDAPQSVVHLREGYPMIADPEARGWAAYTLVNTAVFVDAADALTIVRHALAETPSGLGDLTRALRALEAVCVFFGAGHPDEVAGFYELAGGVSEEGFGARALEAIASTYLGIDGRDARATGDLAARALSDGLLLAEDSGLFWVAATNTLALADRVEDASRYFELARQVAHRRGSLFTALTVHLWEGALTLRRGDLESAGSLLADAAEEIELWAGSRRHTTGYTYGMLGMSLLDHGAVDEAERVMDRAGATIAHSDGENFLRQGRLLLELARGRPERALELARELGQAARRVNNPAWMPWRTLTAICLEALGHAEEAVALATEELELARRWGTTSVVGRGLAILGRLEGAAGIERLQEAAELLAGSPARLEQARALAALGRALRLHRRPGDAREPLRRALELAESCGAAPLVDEVRGELHASGARPRSAALSGPGSLTPSERRVADLAAEGKTNREIAQELYVTPKTVEVHLSRAYRKLGVGSRRELVPALASSG